MTHGLHEEFRTHSAEESPFCNNERKHNEFGADYTSLAVWPD